MKRKALLTTLFNLQGGKCFYCEIGLDLTTTNRENSATVDHVVPKSKEGKKDIFNSVAACRDCNGAKSNQPFIMFYTHIKREKERKTTSVPALQRVK